MPKIPSKYLDYSELPNFNNDEVESGRAISQEQLASAKIFSSREEYIKHLPKAIKYLEVGVAWGYYSNLVCEIAQPTSTDLLDPFNSDLKCWSWRKFGSCQCSDQKHELLFTPETHEQWIAESFSKYPNVKTIKGFAPNDLPDKKDYDYIYIDMTNDRVEIRNVLKKCSNMVKVGGVIGLNDYLIYDGIIEDALYGTYQAVNEFLSFNTNWHVDALALHPVGFYDIYLRRMF